MTNSIDLTGYPYFNLYDSDTNYRLVLPYVGGTSQPRDLIEAQATVQDQVTRIGDTIYKNGDIIEGCSVSVSSSKTQVFVSIGKVYLDGWVESFSSQTTISITGIGLEVIGLVKIESVVTEIDDSNLRNPATNFDKYDPAGSYRLKSVWTWDLLTEEVQASASKVIGVVTLVDGVLTTTPTPVTDTASNLLSQVLTILASRDYEQYGNYIIEGLNLTLVTHPQYPVDMKQIVVKAGNARILGNNTKLLTNWTGNLPVARDTATITNEPWVVTHYNSVTGVGGQRQLGERPVASVQSVVATVLHVDGYGTSPRITRGAISGGSDQLSKSSIVQIIAVNQGGTWNPATETFVGGTTFSPSSYIQDGNNINWSPIGTEPVSGSSYSVAYQYRATLTKQIMSMTEVNNELLTMGTDDTIAHSFICETNDFTGLTFKITNSQATSVTVSDYTKDTDFSVLSDGKVDWYNHIVHELIILRTANNLDSISFDLLTAGYEIESVLSIASLDAEFDTTTRTYTGGTLVYSSVDEYSINIDEENEVIEVDWTLASTNNADEPVLNSFYKVALLEKVFKTSSHPEIGDGYYASYYYWKVEVPGDYLSRDSFYRVYDTQNPVRNQLQHYGLDLQDSINIWRSNNYQSNPNNMSKPYPGSMAEVSYSYYLSRYALINYTKDAKVTITLGTSSESPTEPGFDKNPSGVMLGTVFMPADGLNMVLHEFGINALKITELQNIKSRTVQTETTLATTILELQAKSLPVSNRLGVSTSSFNNDSILDAGWADQKYAIDPDWGKLTLPHTDSFHSTTLNGELTTGSIYGSVTTLVPIGVNTINQNTATYNNSVSLAPSFTNQSLLQESQSTVVNLSPSGDFLVVPRINTQATDDTDIWRFSSIAKLDDPSPWFTGGWRGNQSTDQSLADSTSGTIDTVAGDSVSNDKTNQFMQNTSANCRQIEIDFSIPGGLPDPTSTPLDFYVYFGGILVSVTPTDGTPAGSVSGTFRSKSGRSASGTFTVPRNVPAGQVEVKIISTPTVVNGSDWQYVGSTIFNSSAVNTNNNTYVSCRCNCYSCNRCGNCWSCTSRCGTGPILETISLTDSYSVIRSIELDFASVSPKYGAAVSVIETDNGKPTSSTIANSMLARKYLTPSGLAGGSKKLFSFDDPVLVNDSTYGVLVSGEDGFNLDSSREVGAGRDIRVNVAKFPSMDIYTHQGVNSKQFQLGSFWSSPIGTSWTEDLTKDLTFKVYFNAYPINTTNIVYMETVEVNEATAFLCAWNSQIPEGTSVIFQYTIGDGVWYEFSPFVLTNFPSLTNQFTVKAILSTTNPKITPFVENACSFYVQSKDTRLYAVTNQFSLASGEYADELDIWVDTHLTSTYSQKLRITFNNGSTWVDLNQSDGGLTGQGYVCSLVSTTPINLNVGQEVSTYHWKLTTPLGTHFTSFRTEFNFTTTASQVAGNYPYFQNYIAIPSTT